ncbi:hypothetical protein F5Y16DRAFT_24163 [Xylariaceae sp. FL0255]|nr:hypothetical protein F5Y16DRAFT_24163 [Xylariaceae sp. FL0255]
MPSLVQVLSLNTLALLSLVAAAVPRSSSYTPLTPECDDNGTETFPINHTTMQNIQWFCQNGSGWWWDDMLISPVSEGTGVGSEGQAKTEGIGVSYPIPGTDNELWLGLFYDKNPNGICAGAFPMTTSDMAPEMGCSDRFGTIMFQCQTETLVAKTGGILHDDCRVYAVTAQPTGQDPWPDWFGATGDFECKDTNTTDIPDSSDLDGSCTCWYSNYPDLWDFFKHPAGGSCDPSLVNKAELIRD